MYIISTRNFRLRNTIQYYFSSVLSETSKNQDRKSLEIQTDELAVRTIFFIMIDQYL